MKRAKLVSKRKTVGFRKQLMKYSENHYNSGTVTFEKINLNTGQLNENTTVLQKWPLIDPYDGEQLGTEIFLKRCRARVMIYPMYTNNYLPDNEWNRIPHYSRFRFTIARWRTSSGVNEIPGYDNLPYISGVYNPARWSVLKDKFFMIDA